MTGEKKEQYKTLLILCIGFGLIAWRYHIWCLGILSLILLISGLISSVLLKIVTDSWMWIGEKLGAVMSRVILSIVFVVFLTPIAMMYRLLSSKKVQENKESYFITRDHTYEAKDLEKLF